MADVPTAYTDVRLAAANSVQTGMGVGPLFRGTGAGQFAGTSPNGLVTRLGSPTTAELTLRARSSKFAFDGTSIARTTSDVSGEWLLTAPETGAFDIVARKEDEHDLIAPDLAPYMAAARALTPITEPMTTFGGASIKLDGYHWETTGYYAQTGANNGWLGYTIRLVIPSTELLPGIGVRLSFSTHFGGTVGLVGEMHVQIKAASGDAYDFATTPIPVTLNGSTSFAINGTVTTDPVFLTVGVGQSIVVSMYLTAGDAMVSAGTAVDPYYTAGNSAATVNASGYTVGTAGTIYFLQKVECLVAD